MKIHKSTYQQMDELFKEARQDKPVMNIKEVEEIVNKGHYIPSFGVSRFHIGMNTLIVISGIIISSLLTYFVVRDDRQNIELPKSVITNNSVQQVAPDQTVAVQHTSSTPLETVSAGNTNNHVEPALKKADKERPSVNPDNFLASKGNTIVERNAESSGNTTGNESEIAAPAENINATPVIKKMLLSGFSVGFIYNDDSVEMKLNGDDVTMLSIDHQIIPTEKYADYGNVIREGRIYLAGRRSHNEENYSLDLISFIDSQLRADKILSDSQYLFELSSSQLLINKTAQSEGVFRKYKKLYEDKTGKMVTEGSVYKFEKGAKPE